jgi:SAM-dependent methyltransferase
LTRRRNRPYRLLARFYDPIVGDFAVDMNRHAREKILRRYWRRIASACDVGCGSGGTAVDLAKRGIAVNAVDLAPAFVRATRSRARAAGVRVRARVADMKSFRLPAPVDLVLCEFSALNHLEERRDLAKVFAAVARALKPGGLFLFDIDTMNSLAKLYASVHFDDRPAFKLVQRGALVDGGRRARLDFDWFVPVGGSSRRGDRATYRHEHDVLWNSSWSEAELRRALRRAGLTPLRSFDGLDVRPPIPGAQRGNDLYLLAQKGARGGRGRRGRGLSGGTAPRARASR